MAPALTSMLALGLMLLNSCASSRPMMIQPQSDPQQKTLGAGTRRISGYTLKSGERLSFDGYVEARGETLRFVRPRTGSRGLELPKPLIVRDVPRDSVAAVAAVYTNVPATILLGVGIVGLIALFGALSFAANFAPFGGFGH